MSPYSCYSHAPKVIDENTPFTTALACCQLFLGPDLVQMVAAEVFSRRALTVAPYM